LNETSRHVDFKGFIFIMEYIKINDYTILKDGTVLNKNQKLLKGHISSKGYVIYNLSDGSKRLEYFIAPVLFNFEPYLINIFKISHLNFIKEDNSFDNLLVYNKNRKKYVAMHNGIPFVFINGFPVKESVNVRLELL